MFLFFPRSQVSHETAMVCAPNPAHRPEGQGKVELDDTLPTAFTCHTFCDLVTHPFSVMGPRPPTSCLHGESYGTGQVSKRLAESPVLAQRTFSSFLRTHSSETQPGTVPEESQSQHMASNKHSSGVSLSGCS